MPQSFELNYEATLSCLCGHSAAGGYAIDKTCQLLCVLGECIDLQDVDRCGAR